MVEIKALCWVGLLVWGERTRTGRGRGRGARRDLGRLAEKEIEVEEKRRRLCGSGDCISCA